MPVVDVALTIPKVPVGALSIVPVVREVVALELLK